MARLIAVSLLTLCGWIAVAIQPVMAGDWSFQPTIAQAGTWNSNALMRTASAIELYGSETTVRLAIEKETPTTALTFDNRAVQNLFNKSAYNSTDFHNTSALKRQMERWGAGLNISGDYDTTRTSEITSYGLNAKSVRHWAGAASPEISYRPNERNQIALSGSASVSRYDDTVYTDYNVYAAQTRYTHIFSQALSGSALLNARRYETQNNVNERVDSIGPSAGFSYTFNERLSAQASAGAETSKQVRAGVTTSNWKWSSVFSAGVTYKGEQDRLNIKASRAQQPYGNGSSSLLTSIAATEDHAINSALSLIIGGEYARAQQSGLSNSTLENKWSANGGLAYHITSDVDVNATYRYREESYRTTSAKARDNAALLRVTYKPTFGDAR